MSDKNEMNAKTKRKRYGMTKSAELLIAEVITPHEK